MTIYIVTEAGSDEAQIGVFSTLEAAKDCDGGHFINVYTEDPKTQELICVQCLNK